MFKILFAFLLLAVLASKATGERKSHPLVGGPFFSEFLEDLDDDAGAAGDKKVMKWKRRSTAKNADKEMTKEVSAKKVKKVDDKKKMVEKEGKLSSVCANLIIYKRQQAHSHQNGFCIFRRKNGLVRLHEV